MRLRREVDECLLFVALVCCLSLNPDCLTLDRLSLVIMCHFLTCMDRLKTCSFALFCSVPQRNVPAQPRQPYVSPVSRGHDIGPSF